MSQRAVERALGKMVTDEGFREWFFREPAEASRRAGFNLSPAELAALCRVPPAALARLCGCLDDRICRLHVASPPEIPQASWEDAR